MNYAVQHSRYWYKMEFKKRVLLIEGGDKCSTVKIGMLFSLEK